MNSKKFAKAQVKFEQALTEDPSFAEAHNYLGYSLEMEGPRNYRMALGHYNRAVELKPNLAEAYEYRGVLLLRMGRKTAAEKDLALRAASKKRHCQYCPFPVLSRTTKGQTESWTSASPPNKMTSS